MTTARPVKTTTRRHQHNTLDAVREIAIDLAASLGAEDRYQRLIEVVLRVIPADSAALLRLDGDQLVPMVTFGLVPETMARRFVIAEHPRLAHILRSDGPVRFEDSDLPDPFDGLIALDRHGLARVHACMGSRLIIDDVTIGVIVTDSLDPHAFDGISDELVATVAALAGAAVRTAALVDARERAATRSEQVSRQLVRDAEVQRGEIIGVSAACRALRQEIALSARSDLAVLITGETGVGKELVAQAIRSEERRVGKGVRSRWSRLH